MDPNWEPLSQECLRRFGYFPGPADTHVGEYLGWGWKYLRPEQTAWIFKGDQARKRAKRDVELPVQWQRPFEEEEKDLQGSVDRRRTALADHRHPASLLDNGNRYMLSLNLPNDGYISNLKPGAVVEIPAIVGADRVYGLQMGEMPTAIAGVLELQTYIMDLVVEAAVKGDRQAALEALDHRSQCAQPGRGGENPG